MSKYEIISGLMMVVPDHIKTQELFNEAVHIEPGPLAYAPDHLKTQEMCNEAVTHNPYVLRFVPDHLKTQEMYDEVVRINPAAFFLFSDRFKTQEMCDEAVRIEPLSLVGVPNCLKTQKMCDDAVRKGCFSLRYLPDWFVKRRQIQLWHDEDNCCNDNILIEWYEGYKKRKGKKVKIKEELLPIAWHPDRVIHWCISEDVKRDRKIVKVTDSCF